jgi:alkane 1-monooxygenase
MLPGAWLLAVLTPIYNKFFLDDTINIDEKMEKIYLKNKWFLIPIYTYILAMFLTHIWSLMLFSGRFDGLPMFRVKVESMSEYIIFNAVLSFFGGASSLAGHELVHHKEWYNKVIGNLPYLQFFYTHFWDEHVKGHHKNVATPEDAAFHDVGEDLYTSIVRSAVLTHVKTWEREQERLKDMKNPIVKLASNKMVHYFILHVTILVAIYNYFGIGGLWF